MCKARGSTVHRDLILCITGGTIYETRKRLFIRPGTVHNGWVMFMRPGIVLRTVINRYL
jgi:hypothetical protein